MDLVILILSMNILITAMAVGYTNYSDREIDKPIFTIFLCLFLASFVLVLDLFANLKYKDTYFFGASFERRQGWFRFCLVGLSYYKLPKGYNKNKHSYNFKIGNYIFKFLGI